MDDEVFFAWLDGELDADQARSVEADVRASPELTDRANAHRAMKARLAAAFDPIVEARAPAIADIAEARARRRGLPRPIWQNVAAMAASVAIGLFAGSMIGRDKGPVVGDGGKLVAANALATALDTQLASAPAQNGPRIGLTFRDSNGHLCRSFTDNGAQGLACHENGEWQIRGLFQVGEDERSEFRMAGGLDPNLTQLVGSTIAGEPLDAAAERQAIRSLR